MMRAALSLDSLFAALIHAGEWLFLGLFFPLPPLFIFPQAKALNGWIRELLRALSASDVPQKR